MKAEPEIKNAEKADKPLGKWQRRFLLGLRHIMPMTWQGLLGMVLYNQLVFPLLGAIYPTAEKYVSQKKWDASVLDNVKPNSIRVVDPGIGSRLYRASFVPAIMPFMMSMLPPPGEPTEGFTLKGFPHTMHSALNVCQVYMTKPDPDPKRFVFEMSGMTMFPAEVRDDLPVRPEELFFIAATHEFNHCSPGNSDLPVPLVEGESDVRAINAAVRQFNNAALPQFMIHVRALDIMEDSHDTSLYLDAVFNQKAIPDPAAMRSARKEIDTLMDSYSNGNWFERLFAFDHAVAERTLMTRLLQEHGQTMSPLAKRRAELFIEAVDYLAKPAPAPGVS